MNSESRLQKMPKRNLRVLKWLSATPAIGVCTCCTREFNVLLTALTRTAEHAPRLIVCRASYIRL